jgi:hypothetical protein
MRVKASFYNRAKREGYVAICKTADSVDDGIYKVKVYLCKKNKLNSSDMINKDYEVLNSFK